MISVVALCWHAQVPTVHRRLTLVLRKEQNVQELDQVIVGAFPQYASLPGHHEHGIMKTLLNAPNPHHALHMPVLVLSEDPE